MSTWTKYVVKNCPRGIWMVLNVKCFPLFLLLFSIEIINALRVLFIHK